jgi:hypothetical protein
MKTHLCLRDCLTYSVQSKREEKGQWRLEMPRKSCPVQTRVWLA